MWEKGEGRGRVAEGCWGFKGMYGCLRHIGRQHGAGIQKTSTTNARCRRGKIQYLRPAKKLDNQSI